jgi:hypothetical protein
VVWSFVIVVVIVVATVVSIPRTVLVDAVPVVATPLLDRRAARTKKPAVLVVLILYRAILFAACSGRSS